MRTYRFVSFLVIWMLLGFILGYSVSTYLGTTAGFIFLPIWWVISALVGASDFLHDYIEG